MMVRLIRGMATGQTKGTKAMTAVTDVDQFDSPGGVDWQSHFDEIEEQGFTIVSGIVRPEECAELRAEIIQAVQDDWREHQDLPGKNQFVCLDLVTRSPSFVRLLENPKMHRMFSHFLDDTCILYSSTSTVLQPARKLFTCEIHTDMPRLVPGYHLGLLMTLACDDFTEENGATNYLPGSHRSLNRPTDEVFHTSAVSVTRKAGDAVFFHPRVWHAAGMNKTDTERVGCTVYAVRSWMKQRFDYPRMITHETLAAVGARGRGFLGFNARVPANMHEFYRLPEDRLYKPDQG
jgi:hypothetical protein